MNESILLEALKKIARKCSIPWVKEDASEAIKKWEDSSGKETGMKWRKYNDLPKEGGLYVCECEKRGNGEVSLSVTYGQYIKDFPQIKVDEEKFGKVIRWLDESVPPKRIWNNVKSFLESKEEAGVKEDGERIIDGDGFAPL
jgi:hypothetical protein